MVIKSNFNSPGKDIPSDNAGMSNEKGKSPRLKLMVFIKVTAPKLINLS